MIDLGKLFGRKSAAPPLEPLGAASVDELLEAGNCLEDSGDARGALAQYEQAVVAFPDSAKAHLNKGNALMALGRPQAALKSFAESARLDPKWAAPHFNLGNLLASMNKPAAAMTAYQKAAALRADWAEPWVGIARVQEQAGEADDAIAAYQKALARDPAHAGAAGNLADLLHSQGQPGEARDFLVSALQDQPDQAILLRRLARLHVELKDFDAGVECYARALAQRPDDAACESDLLFTLNFVPGTQPETVAERHFEFGQRLQSRVQDLAAGRLQDDGARLKIGYLSPDFRRHPVSCFMEPVLRGHDRSRFEVHCFFCHPKSDDVTERLRDLPEHWHDVDALDDDALATRIVDEGIDVLIDLAGHTALNRMPVMARRPAPLQMTWLGYLGTTGLDAVDYRICDARTDPPGSSEALHSERLLRLPDSQWCYRPQVDVPNAPPLPRLSRGYWTFGSFNQYPKLNAPLLKTWAEVMVAIPDSRLRVLGVPSDTGADWIIETLAALGVSQERVEILPRVPIAEYFKAIQDVDVALDSFPYNGGTTTLDALICGVPVATVAGDRSISRGGLSILTTLKLEAWIARSASELPAMLATLLESPGNIARLRAELPERMRRSPLMDADRFVKNLEQELVAAWSGRAGD